MPTKIKLTAGNTELEGMLNDSETAQALAAKLPITVRMSRWGEEYYGDVGEPLGVGLASDARDEMKVGELAYWQPGNALCIFFGPTPASMGDEPRAASPVNPVGEITSNVGALTGMQGSISLTVEEAE